MAPGPGCRCYGWTNFLMTLVERRAAGATWSARSGWWCPTSRLLVDQRQKGAEVVLLAEHVEIEGDHAPVMGLVFEYVQDQPAQFPLVIDAFEVLEAQALRQVLGRASPCSSEDSTGSRALGPGSVAASYSTSTNRLARKPSAAAPHRGTGKGGKKTLALLRAPLPSVWCSRTTSRRCREPALALPDRLLRPFQHRLCRWHGDAANRRELAA